LPAGGSRPEGNVASNPTCTAILIHGIGDQPESWSQDFRTSLTSELAGDANRVRLVDAYWAPLSTLEDVVHPKLVSRSLRPRQAKRLRARDITVADETYRRTVLEFSRMLAAEAGAPVDAHTFGPIDILDTITDRIPGGIELVADVGNYVAHNGVRTAVQNVLHACLGEAYAAQADTPVILVSHSQGTVISYDVLRQAGANYRALRTWITMGCPLRKYFAFPLEWGRQQLGLPTGLRWLNLYDQTDIVGRELKPAVDWTSPEPDDRIVDNARNAADAHDHWNNPEVVRAVAGEIVRLLG
jgi:pimeloyl-ACP methyl ester carboxylesterase